MLSPFRDEYGDPTVAGRRLGIAVGIVLLLACGVGFGRMTNSVSASTSPTNAPSVAKSVSTAPALVDAPNGSAPDTRSGAVTAATEADCTLGGPLVTSPTKYQAALAALLVPAKVGDAASLAQSEASQLDQATGVVTAANQGQKVYINCVPLGFRVESFTATTASVSVWTEQIIGVNQAYAPASSYVTETLTLVWTNAGWKLQGSVLLDTQWAPATNQPALPQASTLPAQLVNFTQYEGQ